MHLTVISQSIESHRNKVRKKDFQQVLRSQRQQDAKDRAEKSESIKRHTDVFLPLMFV